MANSTRLPTQVYRSGLTYGFIVAVADLYLFLNVISGERGFFMTLDVEQILPLESERWAFNVALALMTRSVVKRG